MNTIMTQKNEKWIEISREEYSLNGNNSNYMEVEEYPCFDSINLLTIESFKKLGVLREDFEKIHGDNAVEAYKAMNGIQINIHFMLSQETVLDAYTVIHALKNDPRLKYANALVLLHLKQKGRGTGHSVVSDADYTALLDWAFENDICLGLDTCGSCRFREYAVSNKPSLLSQFDKNIEYCCAGRFSFFISADGQGYPCSFMENRGEWKTGYDMKSVKSFVRDVWDNDKLQTFAWNAMRCVYNCEGCQEYNI